MSNFKYQMFPRRGSMTNVFLSRGRGIKGEGKISKSQKISNFSPLPNPLRPEREKIILEIGYSEKGFTLPEITIITGIFLLLFGFIIFNVINAQHNTSVKGSVETLIADMKSQQLKAMVGATEGRNSADVYGIHFGSTGYTLFHGSTYSSADTTNFTVNLDQNLQFYNVTFPGSNIIFSQGSGEVSGFINGQNILTIKDSNGSNQKTITVNRFGAVTNVN